MIHEIGLELAAHLLEKGCSVPVVDGPEATEPTSWGRERIVIEYDPDGSDSFIAPRTQGLNPKLVQVVKQAVKVSIYAQARKTGSGVFEHRRRAANIRDQVVYALSDIADLRKNGCVFTSGAFFVPTDLEKTQLHAGAAYALKLTFERGITQRNFVGEKKPEALPGSYGVASKTNVSLNTTSPVTPETSCGA